MITFAEKIYFGSFFFVFITSGLPMLANAKTYNLKMNNFGKLLGDTKQYDVDSMPWRLRHKLIQDVTAFSAGILTTFWLLLSESGGRRRGDVAGKKLRDGRDNSNILIIILLIFL